MFIGLQGCFFYYYVIGVKKSDKMCHKFIIFATVMIIEKVDIRIRIDESFYDKISKLSRAKGLSVPAFTRYVLKKYFNEYDRQKANPNR